MTMNFLIENAQLNKHSFFAVTSCPPQSWYPNDPSPKKFFDKGCFSLKEVCFVIRQLYPNSIIIKNLKEEKYRLSRNTLHVKEVLDQ
jgi:hypothetical protein